MLRRVALVTSRALPNLTDDDRPLVAELSRLGIAASPEIWDRPAAPWTRFDAVVIRSPWDYHLRFDEFRRWIAEREAEGTPLWNPAPLLAWNSHKFYLRELADKGIPVAPTRFLRSGAPADLPRIFDEEAWERAVVKPAVSAGAHRTVVVGRADAADHAPELAALLSATDVLVQRYLPEVESDGEWSLVFIDGAYSHAILKRPVRGDFRVQEKFGGTFEGSVAAPDLVAQARRVVDAVDHPWLYARVDGIESRGVFQLMELEMVEPSLFLSAAPHSARRLAAAIARVAEEERAGASAALCARQG